MVKFLCCLTLLSGAVCLGAERLCVREIIVPQYPLVAGIAGVQGAIDIDLEIGRDGTVLAAKALHGDGLLIRESLSNVRQWSFAPSETEKFR